MQITPKSLDEKYNQINDQAKPIDYELHSMQAHSHLRAIADYFIELNEKGNIEKFTAAMDGILSFYDENLSFRLNQIEQRTKRANLLENKKLEPLE